MASDEGDPSLTGWRNDELVIGWRVSLCSYDQATDRWGSIGPTRGGAYVTDGRTLAGDGDNRAVSFIDEQGHRVVVSLPAWSDDWTFWGGGLSALPSGGYAFMTVPRAAVISPEGQLSDQPLPDGFLVVSGTSRPGVYVLREDLREHPESMGDAFTAYIWAIGEDRPTPVLASTRRAMPATTGLAWLESASGSWSLVGATRTAESAIAPEPGWTIEPNPDGTVFVAQTDRSGGCERDTPPSCQTQLVDRPTGRVLASYRAGSNSSFRWSGSRVVFVPIRPDPLGPRSRHLVVLDPERGAKEINLPSPQ